MQMLGVVKVADRLDMKPKYVRDHWRRLGLPFRKIGGQLRMTEADLVAYVAGLPIGC